jgi:hypothetical protein
VDGLPFRYHPVTYLQVGREEETCCTSVMAAH